MIKFGRNYRLTIENFDDTIITDLQTGQQSSSSLSPTATVIEFPLSASFTIKRGISNSPNSLDIQLVNLNKTTRDAIFQDRSNYFSSGRGDVTYRSIKLEAGYGDNLYTVFQGNLFEAGSTRRGPDIITYINARDGGYDSNLTQIFQTINAPVSQKQLIETLAGQFPNLQIGAIADNGVIFYRPVVCNGNVYEIIKQYGGNDIFIDLEKIYYLRDFEVIEEEDLLIDATTGILDTPNRQNSGLFVTTLFEPSAVLGRRVQLRSSILPQYDGRYRINSIVHDCVISGTTGGDCKTTLGLLIEGQLVGKKFEAVPNATTRNNS